MSALQIIANKLNNDAALKAVVPVAKQFMVVASQTATKPFLIMSSVGGTDEVTLSGQGQYPRERIQIECVASSYTAARQIADLVYAALVDTIKESIPALNVKDVDIVAAGSEITDYSDDRASFFILADYRVRWRKAS